MSLILGKIPPGTLLEIDSSSNYVVFGRVISHQGWVGVRVGYRRGYEKHVLWMLFEMVASFILFLYSSTCA